MCAESEGRRLKGKQMREIIIVGDDVRDALKPTMPLWCWNSSRPCHTACTAFRIENHPDSSRSVQKYAHCLATTGLVLGKLREEVRRETNRQESPGQG